MINLKIYESISLSSINSIYIEQTEYLKNKIKDIKLEKDPFPHFEEKGLFCDNFYQYLKSLFPNVTDIDTLNSTPLVGKNYPKERYALVVKDYKRDHVYLYDKIKDKKLLFNYVKLSTWFSTIFKETLLDFFNINHLDTSNELSFCIDKKGYKLGPHTDVDNKIVTCLVYMPDDSNISKFGTNILSINNTKLSNIKLQSNMQMHGDKFNIVKTTKFEENNTFVFKRSDISFHSVSELTEDVERKFLLFTIYKN